MKLRRFLSMFAIHLSIALAVGCSSDPDPDPLDGLGLREAPVAPAEHGLPGEFIAGGTGTDLSVLRLNPGGSWEMETPDWKYGIEESSGIWRRQGTRLALFYGAEARRTAENWADLRAWQPSDGVIPFRIIAWGRRTYLVDDARARQFAAAVESGAEPRGTAGGAFFMASGDDSRRAGGPPSLPDEWKTLLAAVPTGEYTRGPYPGGSYELREDGTWTNEEHSCSGLSRARRGVYSSDNDLLVLEILEAVTEPVEDGDPVVWKPWSGTIRFHVVHWGKRAYLVEPGKWLEFVNVVNQGYEPRREYEGFVFLLVGDEGIPVSGPPPVPEEWRAWLLPQPLKGEIVDVLPDGTGVCSLGERHGVRKGMVFYARSPGGRNGVAGSVIAVQEDRCILACEEGKSSPEFTEGMRVLSRFANDEDRE
ncbi:MAG: hypothetical protein AAB074_00950 [Planctomycetota bacterium]